MNLLSTGDEELIRCYLDEKHLRNRQSVTVYRWILRDVLCFANRRSESSTCISEATLRAWLKERNTRCSKYVLCAHARIVDRFLDWMSARGHGAGNPLRDLRRQYQRRLAPIIGALVSPDSDAALASLRPLQAFGSVLGTRMREHVALMRSLGYRYDTAAAQLLRFDRFLQGRPDLVNEPLAAQVQAWRQAGMGARHAFEAMVCGRMLSKAAHRLDSSVAVIPFDARLQREAKALHRRPYIYTDAEIVKLLETARTFPSPMSSLRPLTLYTMIVLAYCAGLRIREIVNLTVGDVCLEDATIEIRNTKFFKSRRLPLAASAMEALKTYLKEREKAGAPTAATAGLFWHQKANRRYSYVTTHAMLVKVLRRSGIKPAKGEVGPRIHDLRHSMVCNRMLSWYQSGVNPQSRLAHLATFMGHRDINSTLVYLTVTPELLQLASSRFREQGKGALSMEERPS